jgi:hypothetical protein
VRGVAGSACDVGRAGAEAPGCCRRRQHWRQLVSGPPPQPPCSSTTSTSAASTSAASTSAAASSSSSSTAAAHLELLHLLGLLEERPVAAPLHQHQPVHHRQRVALAQRQLAHLARLGLELLRAGQQAAAGARQAGSSSWGSSGAWTPRRPRRQAPARPPRTLNARITLPRQSLQMRRWYFMYASSSATKSSSRMENSAARCSSGRLAQYCSSASCGTGLVCSLQGGAGEGSGAGGVRLAGWRLAAGAARAQAPGPARAPGTLPPEQPPGAGPGRAGPGGGAPAHRLAGPLLPAAAADVTRHELHLALALAHARLAEGGEDAGAVVHDCTLQRERAIFRHRQARVALVARGALQRAAAAQLFVAQLEEAEASRAVLRPDLLEQGLPINPAQPPPLCGAQLLPELAQRRLHRFHRLARGAERASVV